MDLVRIFVKQTKADIQNLETAAAANDLEQVRQWAHHIKGAAANLELTALSEASRSLEMQAKMGIADEIPSALAALSASYASFEAEVTEEESRHG